MPYAAVTGVYPPSFPFGAFLPFSCVLVISSAERYLPPYSNNSPLSLVVTMTLFGNMASRVQGDVYFTGVHEIIALTNLSPFHHMQRPFIVKKHSALGNTFPIVVGFRVSA